MKMLKHFPKLILGLSALSLVAMGQISRAEAATATFAGSVANTTANGFTSATGSNLSATAIFDDLINPGKLTVTLINNGPAALAPSDVLTALFWDYKTPFSGLSLDSAKAPTVIGGTPATNVDLKAIDEWKLPNTGNGTSDLPNITQNYGIGTAGLNIFQGGGGQQFNYGIISDLSSTTRNNNLKAGSSQVGTFVKGSATFVLSGLPTGFDLRNIENVRFQYGTGINEASIKNGITVNYSGYTPPSQPPSTGGGTSTGPRKIPEPSTTLALGVVAISALKLRKRNSVAQA